jgi:hypothetical protein
MKGYEDTNTDMYENLITDQVIIDIIKIKLNSMKILNANY